MTDDPNKKQYGNQSGQGENQPNQQQKNNNEKDENSQKRPAQGGHDLDRDQEQQDKGGQRRAS